jgi:hypothetical protein
MLNFSGLSKSDLFLYALSFSLSQEEVTQEVLDFLKKNCASYHLMSIGEKVESERFEYQITIKDAIDHKDLYREFRQIEGVTNVRLNRKNNSERL